MTNLYVKTDENRIGIVVVLYIIKLRCKVKFPITVKTKYLILITLTLAIILTVITILDIVEGKNDVYNAKKDEAFSLLRAVQKAGENVFISSSEVETLIKDKLLNTAYFVAKEEKLKNLTSPELKKLAEETGIEHINIYNNKGSNLFSKEVDEIGPELIKYYKDEVDSINSGAFDYFVPGLLKDSQGEAHYSAVQKRYPPNAGFVVASISSEKLLEFRKKIGIGNLFAKIADTEEIIYLVIQDESGIITANSAVDELSSFSADTFLSNTLAERQFASRVIDFKGEKIFEAVKPFRANGELIGVIRIGLSLKQVDSLIKRTIIRSVAISFLLLLMGVALLIVITDKQNLSLLKDRYRAIQTYTGNILNNMSEGVIATDGEGKINLMNPSAEKILGFGPGEAIGKYCGEIIKDSECIIEKAIKKNGPVEYTEILISTVRNKSIIIGGSADIVRNDDGTINTVVAVIKDVTLQRNIEEAQKRNEKLNAMGELAAGVAHEIKNPLNSIGITVQRFEKEFVPADDKDEYLEMITAMKSEIERVSAIINQFLTFARPPKIELKNVDSEELLKSVYNTFYSRAIKDKVELKLAAEPALISADYSMLKQALVNLIQNAFEAVEEGGTVGVESYRENSNLIITVSDTGHGIPQESMSKIFNLYYTTKQTGSGLGLSIVNQIISEHNGYLKVESKKNEGTKFILTIPLTTV